jgi:hypothetical protein
MMIGRLSQLVWPLGLLACGSLGPAGPLEVTVSRSMEVDPRSSDVLVTVRNPTRFRIVWGRGSSSCQLSADVYADGAWVPLRSRRICTMDLADQGLDPGGSRGEVLVWDGLVVRGGVRETLPAGQYLVRGRAGDHGTSAPLTVYLSAQPN